MDTNLKTVKKVRTPRIELISFTVEKSLNKKFKKMINNYGITLPEAIRLFMAHSVVNGDLSYLR